MASIELHPHDLGWAHLADSEAKRLRAALGDNLVDVLHIGSTAIPGIAAKSTIDLMPTVRSIAVLDAQSDDVRALGYAWRDEFGLPRRRLCTRDDPDTERRLFNVHAYADGDPEIDRHVAFRDYLRAHPDEARAYEAVKRQAAARHPHDMSAYTEAKSPWIKDCERRALAWRRP